MKIITPVLVLMVIVAFTGCIGNETDTPDSTYPWPEDQTDPTGGGVNPKGTSAVLSISFHGPIDFSDIVDGYGGVEGDWHERRAKANFTIYNNGEEIEAKLSFKEGLDITSDDYFFDAEIWITDQDTVITSLLYKYRGWPDYDSYDRPWWRDDYDFNDITVSIPEESNVTLILEYELHEMPSGSIRDGQIYEAEGLCFGFYIFDGKGWMYCPFEVRT